MFQKSIAALCIFILIFLQYGRIFSYLDCKLQNARMDATCNCENKLAENTETSAPASSQKVSGKEKSGDVIFKADRPLYPSTGPINTKINTSYYLFTVHKGFSSAIFHPPRL